jgi:tRNA-Thr(GGU) m(6)t(6)A37 methyltransferase TsaA
MAEDIVLRPVGRVREAESGKEIVVDAAFADALDGVEARDHLWILYWMHELSPGERRILRTHPMGDRSVAKRGVFALHSPCRPNPIGMTRVRLLRREGNRLIVDNLDALDGSPVLDIKSG